MDQLELTQGFVRKTREDGVAIINTGCNEGVDEDGGAVGCEWRVETVKIAEVEVGRSSNVVDVSFKR